MYHAVTMPKELVESLTQKVRDLVREFKEQAKEEPTVQVSPSNTVEQLRMFKQLADEGIITAEEFESKKKQLLAL